MSVVQVDVCCYIAADVTDLEQCLVEAFTELFPRRYKKK